MEDTDFKRDLECAEKELDKAYESKNSMERRYLIIIGLVTTLMMGAIGFGVGQAFKNQDVQIAVAANTTTIAVNSNRLTTLEDNYKQIIRRLDNISDAVVADKSKF
jgi:uncharacterized membrane protein